MPLYEYRCRDCGAETELLVRSSAEKPVCPKCKGTKMEKKFSSFAAQSKAPCGEPSSACETHSCGCGCGCHHHGH